MASEEKKEFKPIKKRYLIIGLLFILMAGTAGTLYRMSFYQSTEDAYVETTIVTVSPKVSGQLVEVLVKDNQKVKKGDLVARIERDSYEAKLAAIDAKYQQALLNQKNAKAVNIATQTNIKNAQTDLNRYKDLYKEGAVSLQQLDLMQANYDKAKAEMTSSKEALLTSKGISVADAQIKELEALKKQAELDLSYTNIYAPQSGTVASKRATEGLYVGVGSPLFAIVPDNVWIVANFKENQLEKMQPGQEVSIKIDTFPHQKFKGKVDSIQRATGAKASLFPPENAVGSFVKIVQRIPVKIVFEDIPNEYKDKIVPGMSAVPNVRVK